MSKKIFIVMLLMVLSVSTFTFANGDTDWPTIEEDVVNETTPSQTLSDSEVEEGNVDEEGTLDTIAPIESGNKELEENKPRMLEDYSSFELSSDSSNLLPEVTIDDFVSYITRKSKELIHLFQVGIQPISVLAFIISALFTLAGSFGRGDLIGKGIFGMIISIIVYVLVIYAPIIMQFASGWLVS